jgi:hypothetical protein
MKQEDLVMERLQLLEELVESQDHTLKSSVKLIDLKNKIIAMQEEQILDLIRKDSAVKHLSYITIICVSVVLFTLLILRF